MKLSAHTKAVVDGILGLAGTVGGLIFSQAAQFPPEYQVPAGIVGLVVGYVASDLATEIDTGSLSVPTLEGQGSKLFSFAKPTIQADIAKLSPSDQAFANIALQGLESVLNKSPPTPAPNPTPSA